MGSIETIPAQGLESAVAWQIGFAIFDGPRSPVEVIDFVDDLETIGRGLIDVTPCELAASMLQDMEFCSALPELLESIQRFEAGDYDPRELFLKTT